MLIPLDGPLGVGEASEAGSPPLGTEAGAAFRLAGLLVMFAPSHFFLDSASFDQFAKSPDGFLDRFSIPNNKTNHSSSYAGPGGANLPSGGAPAVLAWKQTQ